MASSTTWCRACLMVYAAAMSALTGAYLWSQWGVHYSFVTVRNEAELHGGGGVDADGVAFAESGGAEYVLVALFHLLHLGCLVLFVWGRTSAVKMAIGCALLLVCSIMYILFYGCMILQWRLEQEGVMGLHDGDAVGAVAQPTESHPGQPAVSGAGAPGTCSATPASRRAGAAQSHGDFVWTVVETLIDVLAAIVAGPDSPTDADGVRRHPDGTPISTATPFAAVRRLSLLAVNVVGFCLAMWGVSLFDLSPPSATAASRPTRVVNSALTASALSRLANTAGDGAGDSRRQRRRHGDAPSRDPPSSAAAAAGDAPEAKKNQ
ncbi:hypothetical protein NESM_000090000 [Novymonas esmeraldas]|uniref:Uncharacterized protein n=1 Tax=Novymonas esmeraldas TaxID=1808958 RepID=A0AAW0F4Y7_9TRYP